MNGKMFLNEWKKMLCCRCVRWEKEKRHEIRNQNYESEAIESAIHSNEK